MFCLHPSIYIHAHTHRYSNIEMILKMKLFYMLYKPTCIINNWHIVWVKLNCIANKLVFVCQHVPIHIFVPPICWYICNVNTFIFRKYIFSKLQLKCINIKQHTFISKMLIFIWNRMKNSFRIAFWRLTQFQQKTPDLLTNLHI